MTQYQLYMKSGVPKSTIGNIINSRILLISGLFSWNSQNMMGWRVFYVSIACIVCFVAAILALIVGAFLKNRKEG